TVKRMEKDGQNIAALVTGGYHTKGITELLRDKKTSYLVILPKFDASKGKRPYIAILTNKKEPYGELLQSGQYFLATHAYFEDLGEINSRLNDPNITPDDFKKAIEDATAKYAAVFADSIIAAVIGDTNIEKAIARFVVMKKQKAAQDRVRSVVNTWVINYQAYYKANAEALDFTLMNPVAFEALLNRVAENMGVAISVKAEGEEQMAAIKQELADLKAEIGAIKAAGTVTPENMGILETLKKDPATPAKIYEMLPSIVGGRRITPQTVRNATLRLANIPVGPIDNAEVNGWISELVDSVRKVEADKIAAQTAVAKTPAPPISEVGLPKVEEMAEVGLPEVMPELPLAAPMTKATEAAPADKGIRPGFAAATENILAMFGIKGKVAELLAGPLFEEFIFRGIPLAIQTIVANWTSSAMVGMPFANIALGVGLLVFGAGFILLHQSREGTALQKYSIPFILTGISFATVFLTQLPLWGLLFGMVAIHGTANALRNMFGFAMQPVEDAETYRKSLEDAKKEVTEDDIKAQIKNPSAGPYQGLVGKLGETKDPILRGEIQAKMIKLMFGVINKINLENHQWDEKPEQDYGAMQLAEAIKDGKYENLYELLMGGGKSQLIRYAALLILAAEKPKWKDQKKKFDIMISTPTAALAERDAVNAAIALKIFGYEVGLIYTDDEGTRRGAMGLDAEGKLKDAVSKEADKDGKKSVAMVLKAADVIYSPFENSRFIALDDQSLEPEKRIFLDTDKPGAMGHKHLHILDEVDMAMRDAFSSPCIISSGQGEPAPEDQKEMARLFIADRIANAIKGRPNLIDDTNKDNMSVKL
ncbi:MAG TPA: CPBP family intramembrane metalloprotease, partial [Candidatus Omnitrophota bacterium]|nr:CPBP family intramembrane metalloprotease [Candidatus Omnitrophota bacterium]